VHAVEQCDKLLSVPTWASALAVCSMHALRTAYNAPATK